MFGLFDSETKSYQNLNGKEFKEGYNASRNAVLIDVRTPAEFASGTISGSKNIDLMSPQFKTAIRKLNKDREYFLFCRSGSRSAQACHLMAREGFKVTNLKGGIGEWPLK